MSFTPKSSYSKQELLSCSRGELFGPGNARLPNEPMLMFDAITEINADGGDFGKGFVRAEFAVSPDKWFFACHFLEDPVMPGCLGVDALWQLVGFFLGWSGYSGKGRALGCGQVGFRDQVLTTNTQVVYTLHIKRVSTGKKLCLGIADGFVECDGKEIYTCNDLKVGVFKSQEAS